jgi:hypothetical protein
MALSGGALLNTLFFKYAIEIERGIGFPIFARKLEGRRTHEEGCHLPGACARHPAAD